MPDPVALFPRCLTHAPSGHLSLDPWPWTVVPHLPLQWQIVTRQSGWRVKVGPVASSCFFRPAVTSVAPLTPLITANSCIWSLGLVRLFPRAVPGFPLLSASQWLAGLAGSSSLGLVHVKRRISSLTLSSSVSPLKACSKLPRQGHQRPFLAGRARVDLTSVSRGRCGSSFPGSKLRGGVVGQVQYPGSQGCSSATELSISSSAARHRDLGLDFLPPSCSFIHGDLSRSRSGLWRFPDGPMTPRPIMSHRVPLKPPIVKQPWLREAGIPGTTA